MMGFLRRLTGQKAEAPTPDPSPASRLDPPVPPPETEREAAVAPSGAPLPVTPPAPAAPVPAPSATGEPAGPVFSSRAVRDATVVTGAIEALGRFVTGQDIIGDLIHRLETLTPDQVNFLQLSAEPGLIQRALQRAEAQKGTKAAALRKLLGDLAGGAIPEADRNDPLLMPKGPILPPLTSLKPKPAGPGGTDSPAAPVASPPPVPPGRPAPLAPPSVMPGAAASSSQVASVAAAVAAAPLPPRPRPAPPAAAAPPARVEAKPAPKPETDKAAGPDAAPASLNLSPLALDAGPDTPPPVPAPPPSVPATESASLPRIARADAESRRARLMAALTDHLSANEAAP